MKKVLIWLSASSLILIGLVVPSRPSLAATRSQAATVSLVGSPVVGGTIMADVAGLSAGTNVSYLWKANGKKVGTGTSLYLADESFTNAVIKLSISAKKSGYKEYKYTSPNIVEGAISQITPGKITGTLLAGGANALTGSCGSFLPELGNSANQTQCEMQWKSDGLDLVGETGSTLSLTDDLIGHRITLVTTVSSSDMNSRQYLIATTGLIQGQLQITQSPTFNQTSLVGETISIETEPTFSSAPTSVSYQWLRNGEKIKNQTGASYTLQSSDWHKEISLRITAKKTNYVTYQTEWVANENVLKLIIKDGKTITGYSAWDSCEYDDYYSYDCWRHTKNNKWAAAWNEETYEEDYTVMNLSAVAPSFTAENVTWRVVFTGTLGADILVANATDEGLEFVEVESAVDYGSGSTWSSAWSAIPIDSGDVAYASIIIDGYGGFILKSMKIQVAYVG